MTKKTSIMSGFQHLSLHERLSLLADLLHVPHEDMAQFSATGLLPTDVAFGMIENAVGTFSLPLGVGQNLQVNGKEYLVPMVTEEASVIAALSLAGRLVREAGGFVADADESLMYGQIQLARFTDAAVAQGALLQAKSDILREANRVHPQLLQRGGGARDLEVRLLPAPEGPSAEPILVVQFLVDTKEAMGANLINSMMEGVAPLVEKLTGGKVYLRILSNLADRRLARARCRIPFEHLEDAGWSGRDIAEGILQASRFAQVDPYRAATHNKGIMNGVDALAIAVGQDVRAIEAGAHAFAARSGHYRPLSSFWLEEGHLVGQLEMPLQLGLQGGAVKVHPGVQWGLKLLRVESVRELAMVMASVGLSQNLAALRALGSVGIQRGHMALHARSVALCAGARGEQVSIVAEKMVRDGQVKLEKAQEILAALGPTR